MRKLVVVGLLLGILSTGVFAVGFVGTPTAGLKTGQWSIGGEYSYSSQDLDKSKVKGTETPGGPYDYKVESKDFNINRYYGVLSYGLTEEWEVSAKLGLTDVKAQGRDADDPTDEWSGANLDNDFAWGFGTKYTFLKQDKIDWGISAQMNWFTADEDGKELDGTDLEKWSSETDIFDLLVAVGPTIDMDGWKLYGGAFYYYLDGDNDSKDTVTDAGGAVVYTSKESSDLEADGNFGGFIGAQFDLTSNIVWTTDFSAKQNGWGLGTGITFKF
jgi:hypothetical protein